MSRMNRPDCASGGSILLYSRCSARPPIVPAACRRPTSIFSVEMLPQSDGEIDLFFESPRAYSRAFGIWQPSSTDLRLLACSITYPRRCEASCNGTATTTRCNYAVPNGGNLGYTRLDPAVLPQRCLVHRCFHATMGVPQAVRSDKASRSADELRLNFIRENDQLLARRASESVFEVADAYKP